MAIRVFNADDHPMLRKGITDLLTETIDMQWVGSAGDGMEALRKIRDIKPDVALLDIEMPKMTGLEVARTLIGEEIKTKFVLLTLFKDENFLNNALEMGIKGYLLKESSIPDILDCIRSAHKGIPYVNSGLTQFLISNKSKKNEVLGLLSDHEINILKLIAQEKKTSEIAEMLFISPKTVSNHRSNISKKLELNGEQNGLLIWAMNHRELF